MSAITTSVPVSIRSGSIAINPSTSCMISSGAASSSIVAISPIPSTRLLTISVAAGISVGIAESRADTSPCTSPNPISIMPGALLPMSANTPPKNPPNWGAMLARSPLLPLMIPASSPIQPLAMPVTPLKVGIKVAEKVPIKPWTLPLSPAISSPQASSPSTASSDMTAPFLWASSVMAANSSLLAPISGINSW